MVHIFSIEGNIGSGKSTLVRILKEHYANTANTANTEKRDILFMQEPVHTWMEIKDRQTNETILSKFYRDQHTYAFSFQMMAYISRISELKKLVRENPDAIILCERCVLTDKEVFAKMLYDEGKIEDVNYQIYLKWFNEFIEDIPVNGLIYVKADADVCFERVLKRAREGEEIPLEYLKNCGEYHDEWIENEKSNILILDANKNFDENVDAYNVWIEYIHKFIVYNSISRDAERKGSCLVVNDIDDFNNTLQKQKLQPQQRIRITLDELRDVSYDYDTIIEMSCI